MSAALFPAIALAAASLAAEASPAATTAATATTTTTTTATAAPKPMIERRLRLWRRELGDLSAKSVAVAAGRVFAQNMIYNHTVTVFDREGERLADISDRVPRALVGLDGAGFVRGAPVEAAASVDGKTLFVSNYYLLGKGFPGNITDGCGPARPKPVADSGAPATTVLTSTAGTAPVPLAPIATSPAKAKAKAPFKLTSSAVYRIDTSTLEITGATMVGPVPKFLAVTPDGKRLLVSNWCGGSVSIIELDGEDAGAGARVTTLSVGRNPRGIAIEPDSKTAYVALMGRDQIAVIDLQTLEVARTMPVRHSPRHLVLARDGRLFVSLARAASVAVVDKSTGAILEKVRTGRDPRSMALSSDGSALYVGNYGEDSLAVVDTARMKVVQKIATGPMPIGVTFEPVDERVWVSCYGGSVRIYDSLGTKPHKSVSMLKDEAKRFPP